MLSLSNDPKNNSKLFSKYEKETGKNAIWCGGITGQFEYWLWQQNNIRLRIKNVKIPKIEISESKIEMSNSDKIEMSKFFKNFLNEHAYVPKKIADVYTDVLYLNNVQYNISKNYFRKLIRENVKSGVLTRHSNTNYKINKEMLNQN